MAICKDLVHRASSQARELVARAIGRAIRAGILPRHLYPDFTVELPADASSGDFVSNVAITSARLYGRPPQDIAALLLEHMVLTGTCFDRVEISESGCLGFFLQDRWFSDVLNSILVLGDSYGRTNYGRGRRIMVEFASSGPIGHLPVQTARNGALGDTLAAAMDAAGYDVRSEFYVSDYGSPAEAFARDLEFSYLRYFQEDKAASPAEQSPVALWAEEYSELYGDRLLNSSDEARQAELSAFALPRSLDRMRETLFDFRINYQTWFYESSLLEDGDTAFVSSLLKEKGLRENDDPFASDFVSIVAYHYNKFAVRGFEEAISVWDSEHCGGVSEIRQALDATGLSGNDLYAVLVETLYPVKSGKPANVSTLADLMDAVPVDMARFLLLMQKPGLPLELDLDLAAEQSHRNPAYRVLYTHALICGILQRNPFSARPGQTLFSLNTAEELELVRLLAQCPSRIVSTARRRDPSILCQYLLDVAESFHRFYQSWEASSDSKLSASQLALCTATKTALANTLLLMRIPAPESL